MEKLEELLPGINKFITVTLAAESLSKVAERQRLFFLERLDVLQLPPHLPPKPDVEEKAPIPARKLPDPKAKTSTDDFIAQQRMISRQTLLHNGQLEKPSSEYDAANKVPNDGKGVDSDEYEEGLYEEPVPLDGQVTVSSPPVPGPRSGPPAGEADNSDASSTSYESYDEPELDNYMNVSNDGQIKTDIVLPRLKTKRKKTSRIERMYRDLQGVALEGELYHRGKAAWTSAWTKCFCAISATNLFCYKDRDSKPLFAIPLVGYDIILMEKEKGRSNVLRLSHPGCETHFLSADSVSETQMWINRLEAAASQSPRGSETSSDVISVTSAPHLSTGSQSSMEAYGESSMSPNLNAKNRKVTNQPTSDGLKKEKKGKITKFLSETFGKKKGQKIAQHLEISESCFVDVKSLASPETTITGVVNISSAMLLGDASWLHKQCSIRNGMFECYKDDSASSDLEFCLHLGDCELKPPAKDTDRPLALTILRGEESIFSFEPDNRLEHGSWLAAIVKHIGNGGVPINTMVDEAPADDIDNLTYTYVDGSIFSPKSARSGKAAADVNRNCEVQEEDLAMAEERQYVDFSDPGSPDEHDDEYDEPPTESADRQSKVYEEVTDQTLEAPDRRNSDVSSRSSVSESRTPQTANSARRASSDSVESKGNIDCGTRIIAHTCLDETNVRKTRVDVPTNASLLASPLCDGKLTMSRDSSCSSEGGTKRLGETIAKNRAMFENPNATADKWTGFKLAGAPPAKKLINPAATSQAGQSSIISTSLSPVILRTNSAGVSMVDKLKSTIESNNNIIDKMSSSPVSNRKVVSTVPINSANESSSSSLTQPCTSGRISPITLSPQQQLKPTFVTTLTTMTSEMKPASPSVPHSPEFKFVAYSKAATEPHKKDSSITDTVAASPKVDVILRKEVKPALVDHEAVRRSQSSDPLSGHSKNSLTLPSRADIGHSEAREFLTSALTIRLGTSDSLPRNSVLPSTAVTNAEAEEKSRLDELRKVLATLRKERQRIRDQKLSTVLPEDREKIDQEYKRVDARVKSTQQEINTLEEKNLQRIKTTTRTPLHAEGLLQNAPRS